MLKFFDRIRKSLRDPTRSFKDRVFILLTLVTCIVAVIALAEDIYIGENIVEIIALILTVTCIPAVTLIAIRKNKVNVAVRIVVIAVVFVLLPVIFFFGGGLYGGGVIWIIFAYLYTGLVLSGAWKPIMLIVLTAETIFFYVLAYFYPELVSNHTRGVFFIDSATSIIVVGVVCCLMVWFEEWMYSIENKRTKEEADKVEDLVRSQSRFFSSMSHEIRTPINTILGLNEIILRQDDASDEIIKDANNIQGAGKMLLALVNDILDVSKIEAGKMDIVPINYNLGSMVSEIVNMIWLRAEEKGLEFRVEIDPQIPSEFFGDEVRIKQILVNLLNNAVKYTQEGSVTLHIEKEDYAGDEILLLFSVIDTGMGIKQDSLPYLFDAFQRMDEEKNAKIEGTGLGLSIVKQLVDLMDGKITVNSVYTQGSTFMVALRQKVTRHDAIGDVNIEGLSDKKKGKRYEPGFTAPDVKVLIVDDNEMNLEVESKLLEGTLMRVDTAQSGRRALSMTLTDHYDIILMDHLMPEMDGIECLQSIRKQQGGRNNHTPVIVLTANAGSENLELYSSSGFDGYLVKPVSGRELEEMLLLHLPELKIVRRESADYAKNQMNTARGYSRKIPVLITTNSMCDLPKSVMDEHGIDMMPFWVVFNEKKYYDRIEANTDEMIRYRREGVMFESLPPTVEEYESFFGRGMKKAHEIIHISLMSGVSREYENAREAARAYDNVRVVNSEMNSGAMGILVLIAQRMASQGRSVDEIVTELNHIKKQLRCSFVTDDPSPLMKRGTMGRLTYAFMDVFRLKPVINIHEDRLKVERLYIGDLDSVYEKYIEHALPSHGDPDLDLVFVEYGELSEEQIEAIRAKILSRHSFAHVVFQKTSAALTINCGSNGLGISYMLKGGRSYDLSQMMALDEDEWEAEVYEEEIEEQGSPAEESVQEKIPEEPLTPEKPVEKKWYEKIPGIDPETAMQNTGSEDVLESLLEIFYETIDERAEELEGLYRNEDWENYTIKVHALKSSARLVGAVELGDDAEKLEFAGKDLDLSLIREKTGSLLSDLRSYKEKLSPVFTKEAQEETKETGEPEETDLNEKFDRFFLESVYEAIRSGAEKQDEKMIEETIQEALEYGVPEKDVEILGRMEEPLEKSDYEAILGMIPEI